jgi:hypothetical protein
MGNRIKHGVGRVKRVVTALFNQERGVHGMDEIRMIATGVQISIDAPASLRKWPSIKGQRRTETAYPDPYLLFDGTFEECVQQLVAKPASQHHLYEIHTDPQQPLISAVLSAEHAVELARLKEILPP